MSFSFFLFLKRGHNFLERIGKPEERNFFKEKNLVMYRNSAIKARTGRVFVKMFLSFEVHRKSINRLRCFFSK